MDKSEATRVLAKHNLKPGHDGPLPPLNGGARAQIRVALAYFRRNPGDVPKPPGPPPVVTKKKARKKKAAPAAAAPADPPADPPKKKRSRAKKTD